MDARELLAKLAPHGIPLGAVSLGGIPALTAHDVAAAIGMAHLSPFQSTLMRVKYCGDETCFLDLRVIWYLLVHDLGMQLGWPRPNANGPAWMILAFVSLLEHCDPRRCHVCKGAKEITIDAKVIQCQTCKGSGLRAISERKLAKLAGVSRQTWEQSFSPALATCRSELQSIEDQAIRRIRNALVTKTIA